MKMSNINHILQIVIVCTILLSTSCKHKDLYRDNYVSAEVRVVFDWKNAPDATPGAMRLYLFPEDGGRTKKHEFTNCCGGNIRMPVGIYRVICINSDTKYVLRRNTDSFDSFEIYTPDVKSFRAPRAKGTSEERIAGSPDKLYSARDEVTINLSEETQTMTLYPELSTCHYKVTITKVTNLEYVSDNKIAGTLSGMSGGFMAGLDEPADEIVTVPFEMKSDGESELTAEFLTFGTAHPKDVHKLVVYVTMNDGSKKYYTWNVSRQVNEAPNPQNVHITLEGLSLPKTIADKGGFQPGIDDWQRIDVEIPM